jgi:hypothetical protein
MRYRSVSTLSPVDAAYIAGLIDGEGTITLSRRHAKDRRQLVESISSTEAEIVEWVLATVRAGKITRKTVNSSKHAPGLAYAISNRQALALLEQTASFLRSYKRIRATMVLQHYVRLTPRNGRYDRETEAERAAFEEHFLATKARNSSASLRNSGAHATQ